MDLILWRHAHAEEIYEGISDAERKLSGKGLKQASKMASWLDRVLPDNCRILVSPTERTLATAEALTFFGRKRKVMDELAPTASAAEVIRAANWPENREAVLVIGHQPYLGQVAAEVLGHQGHDFSVRKASVWWLTRRLRQHESEGEVRQVYLKAVMSPELLSL